MHVVYCIGRSRKALKRIFFGIKEIALFPQHLHFSLSLLSNIVSRDHVYPQLRVAVVLYREGGEGGRGGREGVKRDRERVGKKGEREIYG